jgi:hypothetical protein
MGFLAGIRLLLVSHAPWVFAERFYAGPAYTDQPGEGSVVIELPLGVTPAASDFRLFADEKPVATAHAIKSFRLVGAI